MRLSENFEKMLKGNIIPFSFLVYNVLLTSVTTVTFCMHMLSFEFRHFSAVGGGGWGDFKSPREMGHYEVQRRNFHFLIIMKIKSQHFLGKTFDAMRGNPSLWATL